MTHEYDPLTDAVIEWHDDVPPVRKCPKCGDYRSIGDFWRRPSYKEYVFVMKQDPAALPNPKSIPPVDSVNCYVCNRHASIKDRTEAELYDDVMAQRLSAGRFAAEVERRREHKARKRKEIADRRWAAVWASPWAHAAKIVVKHINTVHQQCKYYAKVDEWGAAHMFFVRYRDVLRDAVLPTLRACGVDGALADPALTWASLLHGPTWALLMEVWDAYIEQTERSTKRRVKQPYILVQSEPSCLVFGGYEFPDDWRRVKTGGQLSSTTGAQRQGEK